MPSTTATSPSSRAATTTSVERRRQPARHQRLTPKRGRRAAVLGQQMRQRYLVKVVMVVYRIRSVRAPAARFRRGVRSYSPREFARPEGTLPARRGPRPVNRGAEPAARSADLVTLGATVRFILKPRRCRPRTINRSSFGPEWVAQKKHSSGSARRWPMSCSTAYPSQDAPSTGCDSISSRPRRLRSACSRPESPIIAEFSRTRMVAAPARRGGCSATVPRFDHGVVATGSVRVSCFIR